MDIEALLKRQEKFFREGKTKSYRFRIRQLQALKASIQENEENIYRALSKDLKKSRTEAYMTEIGYTLHEITHIIKNLKSWIRPRRVKNSFLLPFSRSWIEKEPYGKVLIISPWNYPLGLALSPLAGSIAAGNCSIIKPSEIAPATSSLLKSMIGKTFSKEYVSVVDGGPDIANKLTKSDMDHIFFTGSTEIAKRVMKSASDNLVPVTLELGGKSPCIVDKDCNVENAASRIVSGKFMNAGQTCIAPDYILVHNEIKGKLIKELRGKIEEFYGDNPEFSYDYSRIINKKHFKRILKHMEGQDIIQGGRHDEEKLYIEPTLIDEPSEESKVMKEEIFGPVLPIVSFDGIDKAISYIKERDEPLALYIFSDNKEIQRKVAENTKSGGICINDTILHISNLNLPFGGIGKSGIGRYHGKASIDALSYERSIMKTPLWFNIPGRFPPYKEQSLKIIKRILK